MVKISKRKAEYIDDYPYKKQKQSLLKASNQGEPQTL
jgi:hypothetical protein